MGEEGWMVVLVTFAVSQENVIVSKVKRNIYIDR